MVPHKVKAKSNGPFGSMGLVLDVVLFYTQIDWYLQWHVKFILQN